MANRNLKKQMITACAALALAVLIPVLAYARFGSPSDPDRVETAKTATTTFSGPDHRKSALLALGEPAERIGEAAVQTTEPAPPSTAQESGPPTADGRSKGGEGDGTSGTSGSTTRCPLPAYPSADCTGVPAGTNLTVHDGDVVVGNANIVIDAQDIRGCVYINAPGVVIRRSKLTCVATYAESYSGAGVVLEDVEINCGNTQGTTAVSESNFTVRRANIHSCENGFDIHGPATVEHSFIHDLIRDDPVTDPHADGAQIPSGTGVAFVHNTIYAGDGTAAIISPNVEDVVLSNVLIKDNLMAGGAYTLYCQQGGPGDNYRVVNNHFSTTLYPNVGMYGAWTDCEDEAQVTGNVFHETGRPVPL
jgi:hypothetical protein